MAVDFLAALGVLTLLVHATQARHPAPLSDITLCQAIVHELHVEIRKFDMRQRGEEDIYDTVPAICLALVRGYTYQEPNNDGVPWRLVKQPEADDDAGYEPAPSVEAMLAIKAACETFTDEWHQQLSELMYKHVMERSAEEIAAGFCPDAIRQGRADVASATRGASGQTVPRAQKKKKRKQKKEPANAAAEETVPDYASMLDQFDTDGSLRRLMQLEAESPDAMLEDAQRDLIEAGAEQLSCSVCGLLVRLARARAAKLPHALAGASEDELVSLVDGLCMGELRREDGLPEYAGNPPAWAVERFEARHDKATGWQLQQLSRDDRRARKRDPPPYDDVVISSAILTRACKRVLLGDGEDDSDVDNDLATLLYLGRSAADDGAGVRERLCARWCGAGAADRHAHSNRADPALAGYDHRDKDDTDVTAAAARVDAARSGNARQRRRQDEL